MTKRILILAAAILVVGGMTSWWYFGRTQAPDQQPATQNQGNINFSPPTNEEKKAADQQKTNNELQTRQPATTSATSRGTLKQVEPVITIARQYNDDQYGDRVEVRAYISGIYESGGKCTAIFSNSTKSFNRDVEGIKDATTTRCDTVAVPREDFPKSGIWSVKVRYVSSTATGISNTAQIEVK